MITAGLKEALITYADLKGSAGVQEISDEFDALFALVKSSGNNGSELIATSVNGKNFGWQVSCTAEERLAVFGEALREINGDRVVQTTADFRCLQR